MVNFSRGEKSITRRPLVLALAHHAAGGGDDFCRPLSATPESIQVESVDSALNRQIKSVLNRLNRR